MLLSSVGLGSNATASAVTDGSFALLGTGLVGIGLVRRRASRNAA